MRIRASCPHCLKSFSIFLEAQVTFDAVPEPQRKIAEAAAAADSDEARMSGVWKRLRNRDRDIVALLMAEPGIGNKQIAARLGTTAQVVKNYLHEIFMEYGKDGREALMLWIADHPWLRQRLAAWLIERALGKDQASA